MRTGLKLKNMRIISGNYKGRTLASPSGKNDIRPTTDRARETLFNILANRIDFENKICLDLFCGTGSIGLEFISRGGKKCTFVDMDTSVIKKNVSLLKLYDNYDIVRNDAVKYLASDVAEKYDIAFADPPYKYREYDKLLEKISKYKLIFILEHDKNFIIPNELKNNIFLQKKIGITHFSFFDFNLIL